MSSSTFVPPPSFEPLMTHGGKTLPLPQIPSSFDPQTSSKDQDRPPMMLIMGAPGGGKSFAKALGLYGYEEIVGQPGAGQRYDDWSGSQNILPASFYAALAQGVS